MKRIIRSGNALNAFNVEVKCCLMLAFDPEDAWRMVVSVEICDRNRTWFKLCLKARRLTKADITKSSWRTGPDLLRCWTLSAQQGQLWLSCELVVIDIERSVIFP